MPRKIDLEKQNRAKEIQKLWKAATIIDLFLTDKVRSPEKKIAVLPQFSVTRILKKTSSLNSYNQIGCSCSFWGEVINYKTNGSSYPSWSSVKEPGREMLYLRNDCAFIVSQFIRAKDSSKNLGVYSDADRTITLSGYTEDDVDWAKSVLRNAGIDTTRIPVESTPVNIKFQRNFLMETTLQVFVKDIDAAVKLQEEIVSNPNFEFSGHWRHVDKQGHVLPRCPITKGTEVSIVPIIKES